MSGDKAKLPASCGECAYFVPMPPEDGRPPRTTGSCLRHAPPQQQEPFELVYWPIKDRTERCGAGAAVTGDGTEPQIVQCGACIQWHQPGDRPITPDYKRGRSAEWWASSGCCTLAAPFPSTDEQHRFYSPCLHAQQGCGDGEAFDSDEQS